jgi:hypothetical protein
VVLVELVGALHGAVGWGCGSLDGWWWWGKDQDVLGCCHHRRCHRWRTVGICLSVCLFIYLDTYLMPEHKDWGTDDDVLASPGPHQHSSHAIHAMHSYLHTNLGTPTAARARRPPLLPSRVSE